MSLLLQLDAENGQLLRIGCKLADVGGFIALLPLLHAEQTARSVRSTRELNPVPYCELRCHACNSPVAQVLADGADS